MSAELLLALGTFAYGVGSALFPGLDGEAFIVASVTTRPTLWWIFVPAVALGQTAGKVFVFQVARRGLSERFLRRRRERRPPREHTAGWRLTLARWSTTLLGYLDRPGVGGAVVLSSATLGLPPLAVVSILAGMRSIPTPVFVLAVLVGRLARFGLIAWPLIALRT